MEAVLLVKRGNINSGTRRSMKSDFALIAEKLEVDLKELF